MTPTNNAVIWGNVTGAVVNWYESAQNPALGSQSYVFDTIVGHEDLYGFGLLSVVPTAIYTVALKGYVQKSDVGFRSVSLRISSGGVDNSGSGGSFVPNVNGFLWHTSNFPTDPSTGLAWTKPGLDAALGGIAIDV
jgi:hypothetical protein